MAESVPAPDAYLDALYGASGYLSQAFPGYTPRAGQVALAQAVDHAIVGKKHLFAEAPTGTGKGIGYAGPASYWAARTRNPAVIVTGNIALQEQLVQKDLPMLQSIVPWKFSYALLKGRSHYLCRHKYQQDALFRATAGYDSHLSADGRRHLDVIRSWADDTVSDGPNGRNGDVSEIDIPSDSDVWGRFSVGSADCLKTKCRFYFDCFAQEALALARKSDLVVTNYTILFIHLKLYQREGLDLYLPSATTYVLDEAHVGPEIARDNFGTQITLEQIRRVGLKVRDRFPEIADHVSSASKSWFYLMDGITADERRYKGFFRGNYTKTETDAWDTFRAAWRDCLGALVNENATDTTGEIEHAIERHAEISEALAPIMSPESQGSHVFFVEKHGKSGTPSFKSKLIDPQDVLATALFQKRAVSVEKDEDTGESFKNDRGAVTVICTSATLTTTGLDFDHIVHEYGAKDPDLLVAASPFQWKKQMLFVLPSGLPDASEKDFQPAMAKALLRTIQLAGGRTLGLFTSYKNLGYAYDAVKDACRDLGIRLLRQGDASRSQMIATFKNDVTSVLLGTSSFWAGVDVPGESLSVVFIDKLPFPMPGDAVLSRLEARDGNIFGTHLLPRALIEFKQGVGRLIRSRDDKGVVVCCDNRANGKYRNAFLKALPKNPGEGAVQGTDDLTDIVPWLRSPIDDVEPVAEWDE